MIMKKNIYGSLADNSEDWIQEVPEESFQDMTDDEINDQKIKSLASEREVRYENHC